MIRSSDNNLAGTKKIGSNDFGHQRFVDIHCHCLPAVDDGPATMSEALALCRGLIYDNVNVVIATPHQLGAFSNYNEAAEIREAVSVLNEELVRNSVALTVVPGGDVRVDERICNLLESDRILTLADGGKYILLELPHEVFIDIESLLVELTSLGIQAIISHPERHPVLAKQPQILLKWLEHAVHLQVTCASLLGDFGVMAQRTAWQFLSSSWSSLVATDSHDLDGRKPCMKATFDCIKARLGETIASLVCIDNPLRVLKGQDIRRISTIGTRTCKDETVSTIS